VLDGRHVPTEVRINSGTYGAARIGEQVQKLWAKKTPYFSVPYFVTAGDASLP